MGCQTKVKCQRLKFRDSQMIETQAMVILEYRNNEQMTTQANH